MPGHFVEPDSNGMHLSPPFWSAEEGQQVHGYGLYWDGQGQAVTLGWVCRALRSHVPLQTLSSHIALGEKDHKAAISAKFSRR